MSEGVFQSIARKAPYKDLIDIVDSSGTGLFGPPWILVR